MSSKMLKLFPFANVHTQDQIENCVQGCQEGWLWGVRPITMLWGSFRGQRMWPCCFLGWRELCASALGGRPEVSGVCIQGLIMKG